MEIQSNDEKPRRGRPTRKKATKAVKAETKSIEEDSQNTLLNDAYDNISANLSLAVTDKSDRKRKQKIPNGTPSSSDEEKPEIDVSNNQGVEIAQKPEPEKQVCPKAEQAVEKPKEKKRPGRPKKNVINITVEIHGIVDQPDFPESMVELVYHNPKIFKKFLTLDKGYNVNEVWIKFDATTVTFLGGNRRSKFYLMSVIEAKYLNHYYCLRPLTIGIKRESLEKIFRSLDKQQYKLSIIVNEEYKSRIFITVRDYEIESVFRYDVEVIQKEPDFDLPDFDNIDYPLSFQMPAKAFKKLINDMAVSKSFTIIKNGDKPMEIACDQTRSLGIGGSFRDESKIKLVSKVANDDVLRVKIYLDTIKPYALSSIGDIIYFNITKDGPICLYTDADKVTIEGKDVYICKVKLYVINNA